METVVFGLDAAEGEYVINLPFQKSAKNLKEKGSLSYEWRA